MNMCMGLKILSTKTATFNASDSSFHTLTPVTQ